MTRKRILLADDSNTVVLMLRMLLSNSRFEILIARNGREAVDLAVAHRPDIIFMDVVMPEMNGFQACRALRARDETKGIPILMLTTRGEPKNVQEGFEVGCTEYLTKPFDSVELMTKLETYLGN